MFTVILYTTFRIQIKITKMPIEFIYFSEVCFSFISIEKDNLNETILVRDVSRYFMQDGQNIDK
jgi:hypothetical protein